MNDLKSITYNTVSGIFVSYQQGEIQLNVNGLGHPRINETWQLTTSITKNSRLLVANASDVTNLKDEVILIPCVLSQGDANYSAGILLANTTGIYLISGTDYSFSAGVTYSISVQIGTAVY